MLSDMFPWTTPCGVCQTTEGERTLYILYLGLCSISPLDGLHIGPGTVRVTPVGQPANHPYNTVFLAAAGCCRETPRTSSYCIRGHLLVTLVALSGQVTA